MAGQYAQLVERINRIVRDRGDVELMVMLDRIVDQKTEEEQSAALGVVVKLINQGKKKSTTVTSTSGTSSETSTKGESN